MSQFHSACASFEMPPGGELPPGAHLATPRGAYFHHGIYVGDGRVVHYGGLAHGLRAGPIEAVSMEQFTQGRPLRMLFEDSRFSNAEVVRRALSRIGEDRYRVLTNNCEHFCEWCVRGEHRSYQVDRWLSWPLRVLRRAADVAISLWRHCAASTLPTAREHPMSGTSIKLIAALLAASASAPALADGESFYGPLRSRDLSPFGFLRLDMRPAHAVNIEPGTWAFETEIDYQNTWALSEEVENYLVGLEAEGRRRLGPAEVQAIRDLEGENYLLDFEGVMFSFAAHYKISPNWSAYGILSAVNYGGGFLDGTIESFHDSFGFSSFGRPAAARNRTTLIYDLKGAQAVFFDSPSDGGLLDPVFGARYSGFQISPAWRLTLEGAVKVPLQGERLLLSTGKADYGLQAALQRTGQRHAFYFNAAAVYYAGASEPAAQDSQVIPTLIAGYEFKWTQRTHLNIQAYASKSVYSHRQTDLDELTGNKYQYSIGLRHRRENWLWTIGFNENVQNINNTPDIGFQLGAAWIPRGAGR